MSDRSRDPVVILHSCADMVPHTRGEEVLREYAKDIADGRRDIGVVRTKLRVQSDIHTLYSEDERAAFDLAMREMVR